MLARMDDPAPLPPTRTSLGEELRVRGCGFRRRVAESALNAVPHFLYADAASRARLVKIEQGPAPHYHFARNGGFTMNAWESVATTIRERRSNLNVDGERPVPSDLVQELLGLAGWAPNHYRTNPFRFVVLTGAARGRLGEVAAREVGRKPDAKEAIVERQRVQFMRAPTVIVAASAPDEDPIKHFENKYTVAAGVQNLLLGAQAAGLAAAWRSGPAMVDPDVSGPVKEALGLDPNDEIVGFIYLGYAVGPPGAREQAPVKVSFVEA